MPRESRLTRRRIRTLVADKEAAGVLNTHVTLERPAVRRHKVAQGARLLDAVLNPHVLVQPRLRPEGQVAVLTPVLAHVAPDVVPAQLIRRAALEVAAVAPVGDVRVLGLLMELELGQGGGGQAADLAGEAGAEVHQPDVVSQVVQRGETRVTLPAHDVGQGSAVGSFPGHFILLQLHNFSSEDYIRL